MRAGGQPPTGNFLVDFGAIFGTDSTPALLCCGEWGNLLESPLSPVRCSRHWATHVGLLDFSRSDFFAVGFAPGLSGMAGFGVVFAISTCPKSQPDPAGALSPAGGWDPHELPRDPKSAPEHLRTAGWAAKVFHPPHFLFWGAGQRRVNINLNINTYQNENKNRNIRKYKRKNKINENRNLKNIH